MGMYNEQRQSNAFSYGPFVWWVGVVVDRMDPLKMGRVRVRVREYHSKDTGDIANDDLPWATVLQSITSAAISGVGFSPTGLVEGSTVVGFFADGHQAQTPVVIGSLAGIPPAGDGSGFSDPNGKYPKFPDESDCNRLSRNEKIGETIVQKKLSSLDKSEIAQFSDGKRSEWEEHPTQYKAEYPFNHSYESESGHTVEFDDTEGSERYHRYHRKGGFEEIDPEGKQVEKVVNDNYRIVEGDDYHHVHGDGKRTTDGDEKELIKGNSTIEIVGKCEELVHGNYNLKVKGNYTIEVLGNLTITVDGSTIFTTKGSRKDDTSGPHTIKGNPILLN